jgi:hypothetical protein
MRDSYETVLENYRNAWKGLHMIREVVETLGPPGILPSQEAVVTLYGPEPTHEAQAIVDALTKVLGDPGSEGDPFEAVPRKRRLSAGFLRFAPRLRAETTAPGSSSSSPWAQEMGAPILG